MDPTSEMHEAVDEVVTVTSVIAQEHAENPSLADPLSSTKDHAFSIPSFAKARLGPRKRFLPQIIAHRGFKAKYPDNSLLAFREAVKAGATALETDVRMTKDRVVVLSHDEDLKRFGHEKYIADTPWSEISRMKTLPSPTSPHEVPMLRLSDLLSQLLTPEFSQIWLLLDMKSDEPPESLMRLTRSAISSVPVAPGQPPWTQRIILGLWASWQLPLASSILPGFPALNIAFHLPYSTHHFGDPHLGSLMRIHTLLGPGGAGFMGDRQTKPGPTMAWTVNDWDKAVWCARRGLDGIVTDDPEFIRGVWEEFDWGKEPILPISLWGYLDLVRNYIRVQFYFSYFIKTLRLEQYAEEKGLVEGREDGKVVS